MQSDRAVYNCGIGGLGSLRDFSSALINKIYGTQFKMLQGQHYYLNLYYTSTITLICVINREVYKLYLQIYIDIYI